MTSPQFNLYLHELPAKILDGDAERLCRQGLPFKVGGLKRFAPHWTRLNHDPFIENVVLTQTITHFTTKPRIPTEEVKLEIKLHGKPEKYEDGVNYGQSSQALQLNKSEIWWRDRYNMLERRGYRLLPRYSPDWKPSWIKPYESYPEFTALKATFRPDKYEDTVAVRPSPPYSWQKLTSAWGHSLCQTSIPLHAHKSLCVPMPIKCPSGRDRSIIGPPLVPLVPEQICNCDQGCVRLRMKAGPNSGGASCWGARLCTRPLSPSFFLLETSPGSH